MANLNMVQALNLALNQEMAKDPTVVLLGEDIGVDGGVFRVTEGLFGKYGSERVIDTPLAESVIIGASFGMAVAGLKPVVEIQFDGFSYLTLPQLECNVGRYRTRSMGTFTAPLVMRMPYGGGVRAIEHHSESKETYYAHTPGLKTVIPSTPRTARALLIGAIRDPDPVIFMEPKRLYRAFREEVPDDEEVMEIGKARKVFEGLNITVIAWGAMLHVTQKVVEELHDQKSISIDLIDLQSIYPLDTEMIAESVRKTGRCVIVQEAQKTLGVASELIAIINEKSFEYLQAPIKRVTMYDVIVPTFGRENLYFPTPGRIRRAIEETLDYT